MYPAPHPHITGAYAAPHAPTSQGLKRKHPEPDAPPPGHASGLTVPAPERAAKRAKYSLFPGSYWCPYCLHPYASKRGRQTHIGNNGCNRAPEKFSISRHQADIDAFKAHGGDDLRLEHLEEEFMALRDRYDQAPAKARPFLNSTTSSSNARKASTSSNVIDLTEDAEEDNAINAATTALPVPPSVPQPVITHAGSQRDQLPSPIPGAAYPPTGPDSSLRSKPSATYPLMLLSQRVAAEHGQAALAVPSESTAVVAQQGPAPSPYSRPIVRQPAPTLPTTSQNSLLRRSSTAGGPSISSSSPSLLSRARNATHTPSPTLTLRSPSTVPSPSSMGYMSGGSTGISPIMNAVPAPASQIPQLQPCLAVPGSFCDGVNCFDVPPPPEGYVYHHKELEFLSALENFSKIHGT
ncbi:hypothetical protein MKEN_01025800 [Mycena kentingensis (nom. inval.)]|nr:hypothetical protein MKEN_01025800 [Mycena kentingensis (nom. inval.)]